MSDNPTSTGYVAALRKRLQQEATEKLHQAVCLPESSVTPVPQPKRVVPEGYRQLYLFPEMDPYVVKT